MKPSPRRIRQYSCGMTIIVNPPFVPLLEPPSGVRQDPPDYSVQEDSTAAGLNSRSAHFHNILLLNVSPLLRHAYRIPSPLACPDLQLRSAPV